MTYIAILPNPFLSIASDTRKVRRVRKLMRKAKRAAKPRRK